MGAAAARGAGAWTWTALAVALAGPPLFVLASRWSVGDSPRLHVQIALQALYCVMAAFVVWVVRRREHLSFESIGLRRPAVPTLMWAVLLFAAIQLLPVVERPLVRLFGSNGLDAAIQHLRGIPLWFRLVLAVTGGVVEEIFYRGYAIERLALLVNRRWMAGAMSATAFGLAHIPYWGVGFSLAADLPFGIVMTASYLWRRDLAANMLAHCGALVLAMLTV
jgi:membrane protease YdiL (CAAX protease family)